MTLYLDQRSRKESRIGIENSTNFLKSSTTEAPHLSPVLCLEQLSRSPQVAHAYRPEEKEHLYRYSPMLERPDQEQTSIRQYRKSKLSRYVAQPKGQYNQFIEYWRGHTERKTPYPPPDKKCHLAVLGSQHKTHNRHEGEYLPSMQTLLCLCGYRPDWDATLARNFHQTSILQAAAAILRGQSFDRTRRVGNRSLRISLAGVCSMPYINDFVHKSHNKFRGPAILQKVPTAPCLGDHFGYLSSRICSQNNLSTVKCQLYRSSKPSPCLKYGRSISIATPPAVRRIRLL